MSKAAAIAAQLVDVRNVQTHKCVRLTIEVPAEQAMLVMEAFGWPTQVDPVPVAIARLNLNAGASAPHREGGVIESAASPSRPRKPVAPDKRLAQQAGICCSQAPFWYFLKDRYCGHSIINENEAAAFVRSLCGDGKRPLTSRAEIIPGTLAGDKWIALESAYTAWKLVPERAA